MKNKEVEVIETIGSITKMESLRSLERDVLENTLVLLNTDPFPGYRPPKDSYNPLIKPASVFIVLRYRYAPEKINRINQKFARSNISRCYPSFGEIITRESILPCIRIKGLQNYDVIPGIQSFFKQQELELMEYRAVETEARIKIFKNFRLIEIAEGLYRDLNDGEKLYIRIPKSINWKFFDSIQKKIKYNLENPNFDAAMGTIYRFCGPEDVIRIYDHDKSLRRAMELKKHFIREVKSDVLLSAKMHP